MNRRQFLKAFGVSTAAVPLAYAMMKMKQGQFAPAARTAETHVIERLTFGVTPQLYTHVHNIGASAFVEEQLNPEALADSQMNHYLRAYKGILRQNATSLIVQRGIVGEITNALYGGILARALQSDRQLYERMVHFFSNHFYIYVVKARIAPYMVDYDRDVIRKYAMANFRQLLGASAHSPAMLYYLDNAESTKDRPNENYAREMMELHTLSADGGYTETDVKEVARCFTGWSIVNVKETQDGIIHFVFRSGRHDDDAKSVLGTAIPAGGGEQDGETVLDLLAKHPSTARFISTKIARRFVSDTPPDTLIERLSATFQQSNGDIRSVLRDLFDAPEFWNAPPKFKLPLEYLVSVLRALNIEMSSDPQFLKSVIDYLNIMGNTPYLWPAPSGFPDVQSAWLGSIIARWNIALAVTSGKLPGVRVDFGTLLDMMRAAKVASKLDNMLGFMGNYLLGRDLTPDEQAISAEYAQAVAQDLQGQFVAGTTLLLASPAFQYR